MVLWGCSSGRGARCLTPFLLQICGLVMVNVSDEVNRGPGHVPGVRVLEGREVSVFKYRHKLIIIGGVDHTAPIVESKILCMIL